MPDDSQQSHEQVYGDQPHEGKLSHEIIAGAASFEAFKAFEDHRRNEGKPILSTPALTRIFYPCLL